MHSVGRLACILAAFAVTALVMGGRGFAYDAASRGTLPQIHFARSE